MARHDACTLCLEGKHANHSLSFYYQTHDNLPAPYEAQHEMKQKTTTNEIDRVDLRHPSYRIVGRKTTKPISLIAKVNSATQGKNADSGYWFAVKRGYF